MKMRTFTIEGHTYRLDELSSVGAILPGSFRDGEKGFTFTMQMRGKFTMRDIRFTAPTESEAIEEREKLVSRWEEFLAEERKAT